MNMKIKPETLTGPALDWAVAKCLGRDIRPGRWRGKFSSNHGIWQPTENWAQGGPIIESEKITVVCAEGAYNPSKAGTPDCFNTYWVADIGRLSREESYGPQGDHWGEQFSIDGDCVTGPTPLIAAMRCFVARKLGGEVEIPDELISDNQAII